MKKSNTLQITCPNCGISQPLTVWNYIDSNDKLLVEQEMDCNFFHHSCKNCKETYGVKHTIIYAHHPSKTYIKYQAKIESKEEKKNTMELDPNYQMIYASDRNEFIEKVRLLQHGYDLHVVELMKLALLTAIRQDGDNQEIFAILVTPLEQENKFEMVCIKEQTCETVELDSDLYDCIYQKYYDLIEQLNRRSAYIDLDWAIQFSSEYLYN